MAIRDAVREVFKAQLEDASEEEITATRRGLNAVYDAYVSKTNPSVRYLLREHSAPEGEGTELCTSPLGTGVNDPNRGQPRYGNATRGSCKQSVNVSDAH